MHVTLNCNPALNKNDKIRAKASCYDYIYILQGCSVCYRRLLNYNISSRKPFVSPAYTFGGSEDLKDTILIGSVGSV